LIAERIDPGSLAAWRVDWARLNPVTGTNGKTTTSRLLGTSSRLRHAPVATLKVRT
jgi:UDP-N-acetylmuramoylalanine-D-glutamate ligase